MPISRRQFFRGFTGQSESLPSAFDRSAAIDAYVRANFLPYDFSLTDEQEASVLAAVRSGMVASEVAGTLTESDKRLMAGLAESSIQPLRDQFWRAEEARRNALVFVREFLNTEATPENLQAIRARFDIPYLSVIEDEIERHALSWLYGLPHERLAPLEGPGLKELVLSELRTWC